MTLAVIDTRDTDPVAARLAEVQRTINRTVRLGTALFVLFFVVGGIWLVLAPLNSAAVGQGTIVAASKRKTVQHYEGGIISEILVREGDVVRKGQVLMRLADTITLALRNQILSRLNAALSLRARLIAERDNATTISFDSELLDRAAADPEVQAIIEGQLNVFESRQRALNDQVSVLNQRILQWEELIRGAESQIRSRQLQGRLLDDEIATVKDLFERGNALKPRLLALQRGRADVDAGLADLNATIARSRQSIGESRMQILAMRSDRNREVVLQLREVQDTITDLGERLKAAEDQKRRLEVVAPEDGTVLNVRNATIGGVLRSGEAAFDLVPVDDAMVVEAQLKPTDIDVVHAGQAASVRLSAYKTRSTPLFHGKVVYVSADRMGDQTGQSWFIARIEIDKDQLKHYPEITLHAGSPAEVMITTGERTAMDYILSPFTSILRRSFIED